MAPDADGRISGLQHSGAAVTYAGWLGYVQASGRLEVCQNADEVVPFYEGQWIHWKWSVHQKLCDSEWVGVSSELAAEVYV